MRRYVEHVLALLPFEPEVHAKLGGPACTYVGHPLIEDVAELRPNEEEARRRLGDRPVLLVVPGSRGARSHAACCRSSAKPFSACMRAEFHSKSSFPHCRIWRNGFAKPSPTGRCRPRIAIEPADKQAAFRLARAALVKSGTVTLELALAGVPMVAAYKVTLFEELVARATINVHSVILANLVIGENVVPEFLQRDCTPQKLADALVPLLGDSVERRTQLEGFARLDAV